MVEVDYSNNGTLPIEWKDDEWARIRAIKDAPNWSPNHPKTSPSPPVPVQLRISPLLKARGKEFAKAHGVSFNALMESTLKVLTEEPISK